MAGHVETGVWEAVWEAALSSMDQTAPPVSPWTDAMPKMLHKFEQRGRSLEGVFNFLQEKQSISSLVQVLPLFFGELVDKRRQPSQLEGEMHAKIKRMFEDFDLDG